MKQHRVSAALAAACLVLSLALPAGAAAPASEEEAVQVVNALGIMVGDARGEMNLSSPVTRAEFITMAVKTSPGGEQVGQSAVSPFPDVPRDHWASGYVEAGVSAGLISGYADGTFRPNSRITLAEGATIALGLLGYGPNHFSGAYPTGQLALYRSLKLDRGVSVSGAADRLTRRDAMYLFYNLMTAPTKEGRPYLETLGYSLNAAGELDLVARDRKGTICFVEVKLRSAGAIGLPREFVDARKQERLRKAAACYLSTHGLDAPARFDVAEVYTDEGHRIVRLEYLADAFQ